DERTRTDHLGEQVEDRHGDRGDGGGGAYRALLHPEGQNRTHGAAAGVAKQLRHEEQGHEPGHEETDGVEETVVPEQGDHARDAEEGSGGHVVARDRKTVLGGGEATPTGVEVGGVVGASARPDRDVQGRRDDDAEQADGDCTAAVTDSARLGGELLDTGEVHLSSSTPFSKDSRTTEASGSRRLRE